MVADRACGPQMEPFGDDVSIDIPGGRSTVVATRRGGGNGDTDVERLCHLHNGHRMDPAKERLAMKALQMKVAETIAQALLCDPYDANDACPQSLTAHDIQCRYAPVGIVMDLDAASDFGDIAEAVGMQFVLGHAGSCRRVSGPPKRSVGKARPQAPRLFSPDGLRKLLVSNKGRAAVRSLRGAAYAMDQVMEAIVRSVAACWPQRALTREMVRRSKQQAAPAVADLLSQFQA